MAHPHRSIHRTLPRRVAAARALGTATALLAAGCGDTALAPFGQLESPVALAVHRPSGNVFIASLGANELRVFDGRRERFLTAPVAVFPLSIPTVRNPTGLAAADRFVFVLSGPDAELGFVDTRVPEDAAGPRSVDVAGYPLTLPLDMLPSDVEAFAASWAWGPDGSLADHVLVAGLDDGGEGGVILAARPPVEEGGSVAQLPSPEAVLELPGIYPSAIALDSTQVAVRGLRGEDGARIDDCRTLAVADGRYAPDAGHAPGIWLTSARVSPDGSLSIDPLDPATRIEIPVEVELPDGTVEERAAPVRDLAFVPAPMQESSLAAVAAEPCSLRSGRIYAILDPAYCTGIGSCPDVAVVDLAGPDGPGLAPDAVTGGPALYDFPNTMLQVTALTGPFDLPVAYAPAFFDEEGDNLPLDSVAGLGLLTSSNGSVFYLAGGLGPYLQGPDPADRAPTSAAFPVDAEELGPRVVSQLARTDAGLRGPAETDPQVVVPDDALPRDETWRIAYQVPLPGFRQVGRLGDLGGDGLLRAPEGTSFLGPVPVLAAEEPREADRLVPVTFSEVICEGFPVVEVAADGRFLQVDRDALENDELCLDPTLPLQLRTPLDLPWWVEGEELGFAGRLPAAAGAPDRTSRIFAGGELQFEFTPPEVDPTAGATYEFSTSDGFQFYMAASSDFDELPAATGSWLAAGPGAGRDPDWRVFIAYSGTNSLAVLRPAAPGDVEFFQ